jgi:hypothetical protein
MATRPRRIIPRVAASAEPRTSSRSQPPAVGRRGHCRAARDLVAEFRDRTRRRARVRHGRRGLPSASRTLLSYPRSSARGVRAVHRSLRVRPGWWAVRARTWRRVHVSIARACVARRGRGPHASHRQPRARRIGISLQHDTHVVRPSARRSRRVARHWGRRRTADGWRLRTRAIRKRLRPAHAH